MNFKEFKNKYEKVKVKQYPNNVTKDPLVTVHIQTYQHAEYIRDCLDSILNQKTEFSYEILVGEDESTDGTREICIEYAKKHPDKIRLFLHSRANNVPKLNKPSEFFNITYNRFSARGKYLASCDGDDYWIDSLKLQKQVEVLENYSSCMAVCTNFRICDINKKIIKEKRYDFPEDSLPKFAFKNLLNYRVTTRTLMVMWRNCPKAIEQYAEFSSVPLGDKVIILLMAQYGDIKYIDDITAVFRKGSGFYTPNRKKQAYYREVITWSHLYKYYQSTCFRNIVRIQLHDSLVKRSKKISAFKFLKEIISPNKISFSIFWFIILKAFNKNEIPSDRYLFV
jgi:glycosyltransferase involved in cell wall biosynthesis